MANNTGTINGITYFKLSKPLYDDDWTKNCGLLGNELDSNFLFVRKNIVKSLSFNDKKELVLTKVDGTKLTVNVAKEIADYKFSFEKNKGILTVVAPDGTKTILDGFMVDGKDLHVTTDSTLIGDGTLKKPLGITPMLITGQYAPVDRLVDISESGVMPEGRFEGERVLTKEIVDYFGKLYTYREVSQIAEDIKNTGWRIPTDEDWNDVCNSIECEEYKNHSNKSGFHGKIAGKVMKSELMWDEKEENYIYGAYVNENHASVLDEKGFSILPMGYYDNPADYNESSLGTAASFWSSKCNEDDEVYCKLFDFRHDDVKSTTFNKDARLSLRLVRDLKAGDDNVLETEVINNTVVPVVRMDSDITGSKRVWTKVNIALGEGKRPEKWDEINAVDSGKEAGFYISEWNGKRWIKRQMRNGETVVIKDYDGDHATGEDQYKEWMLINGELVNNDARTEDLVKEEQDRAISAETALHEDIEEESQERQANFSVLELNIRFEKERAEAKESELVAQIDTERTRREEDVERLESEISAATGSISEETERAKEAERLLSESIISEKEERISKDNEILEIISEDEKTASAALNDLNEKILNEAKERNDRDERLNEMIASEVSERENAISEVSASVENETSRAKEAEQNLQNSIESEENARISGDTELNEKFENAVTVVEKELDKIEKDIVKNKVISSAKTITVNDSHADGTYIDVNIDNKTILAEEDGKIKSGLKLVYFEPTEETVLKEYALCDRDGNKIPGSETIKINKDSSIVEIRMETESGKTYLVIEYINAAGKTATSKIDVSEVIVETEFRDGLKVENGMVSVKIDNTGKYLSVSENGVKADGIDTAIAIAVDGEKDRALAAENTLSNTIQAQSERIATLETKVADLEHEVSELWKIVSKFKDIEIVGAENEISVSKDSESNTFIIGFADDAIFDANE